MHASYFFSALALFVATISAQTDVGVPGPHGPQDPLITLINMSKGAIKYDIARDSTAPSTAFNTCTGCISVPAGATVKFHPGVRFNGAITSSNGGVRHEINFGDPTKTFYDADMQYSIGDATVGPTNNQPTIDGRPSLSGEQDSLAKANAGWKTINNNRAAQQALLATGYVTGTAGGSLTAVKNDINSPLSVIAFFQITAQFNAYIGTGSVANVPADITTAAADKHTLNVATNQMTITQYV